MTLPIEKAYSIANTKLFLVSLLDPRQTPKVPLEIRKMAARCLRHYPMDHEIDGLVQNMRKEN